MIYLLLLGVVGVFVLSGSVMERNWLPERRHFASIVVDAGAAVPWAARPTAVRRTTQSSRLVLSLGRREARRFMLHPVMLAAVVLSGVMMRSMRGASPTDTYNHLTTGFHVLITMGVLGALVVHLVVSEPRRAHLEEQFTAMPAGDITRTLALLVGCLGPAAAAGLLVALTWLTLDGFSDTFLLRSPSLWSYAVAPLTVLGGLWLGVMLGRWAPWRGAGAVGLFVFILLMYGLAENVGKSPFLAPYFDRAVYNKVGVYEAGSEAWHFAYIAGLCAMASIGALLRSPGRHLRLLLSLGAGAVLATAYAGWAQIA